jgi:hypothetical protein
VAGVVDPFREADVLKPQSRGSEAATSAYRALAQSRRASTRAGVLVRSGRTLKNAGCHDAALRA